MRACIYENITFVFTRMQTAYDFIIRRQSPAISEMQRLQFAFLFPTTLEDPKDDDTEWQAGIVPWPSLCRGLSQLPKIRQISIWLDALDYRNRRYLLNNPELYPFSERIASLVTLNLPAKPAEQLQKRPELEHPCSIVKRDYPTYQWQWAGVTPCDGHLVCTQHTSRTRIGHFDADQEESHTS